MPGTPDEVLAELSQEWRSPLQARLAAGVRKALGASLEELREYAAPLGDAGLFGPGSIAWSVHADLPAMLIGGLSALMYQTLHPLAMAGVAAHSRFREDPYGRLQRTARFIAGTTFGATPFAEQLIGEVKAVHDRVSGTAPDGRAYSANDPALLTFVHTTEVWSFLRSYQRYAPRPLLSGEKDRYLDEVARTAELLGAREVPRSVAAVRRYLRDVEAELVRTPEAAATVHFLLAPVGDTPLEVLGQQLLTAAAVELLPANVARRLGLSSRRLGAPGVRAAAGALARGLRWSVGPSAVAAIAAARVEAGMRSERGSALSTMEC